MKHEKIEGVDFYRLMADEIDIDGNEKQKPAENIPDITAEKPGSDETSEADLPEEKAENKPEDKPEDNAQN